MNPMAKLENFCKQSSKHIGLSTFYSNPTFCQSLDEDEVAISRKLTPDTVCKPDKGNEVVLLDRKDYTYRQNGKHTERFNKVCQSERPNLSTFAQTGG